MGISLSSPETSRKMKDFSVLEGKLDLDFKNKDLLAQAFCHRSYINENPDFPLGHNERLEFLGDAVLELVVTEHLYNGHPDETEGNLTSWRAALVNTRILSETSKELGFDSFILLSKGEAGEVGRNKQSILADTFEALVGAIYLDGGYEPCKRFIEARLTVKLSKILELGLHKDSKSRFQEEAQSREGTTPSYKVLQESGPDHRKVFVLGVFIGEELIAQGKGFSKQEAEEEAARKALETKGWNGS